MRRSNFIPTSQTTAFVTVSVAGVQQLTKKLQGIADSVDVKGAKGLKMMGGAVKTASKPILDGYRAKAKAHDVTGNLGKSTKTFVRTYTNTKYGTGGVVVAATGPEQTGRKGATNKRPSGNHAWLVEFGSPPRRPGTKNRRTYVNVHQAINGRMKRIGSMHDEEFARQKTGFYFLMGSLREPTRQARAGSGYPHDFAFTEGRGQHPYTLHPGETYGGMPAQGLMQKTLASVGSQVNSSLISLLTTAINKAIADQSEGRL
jgi:hypothetical protein